MENFEQLNDKLHHGAKTEIAKRAKVSLHTVIRCFKGESHNRRVINATAEYLKEVDELDKCLRGLSEVK